MRYLITLTRSHRRGIPAQMRVQRDTDKEAIDAARRFLRFSRNSNAHKAFPFDTWLLMEIAAHQKPRKVATGKWETDWPA
jgi:hypothetical protein